MRSTAKVVVLAATESGAKALLCALDPDAQLTVVPLITIAAAAVPAVLAQHPQAVVLNPYLWGTEEGSRPFTDVVYLIGALSAQRWLLGQVVVFDASGNAADTSLLFQSAGAIFCTSESLRTAGFTLTTFILHLTGAE